MESTQSTTQNVLDFNKICRTCLSTENLLPICGALHSDLTSIEFVLNKYAYIKVNNSAYFLLCITTSYVLV